MPVRLHAFQTGLMINSKKKIHGCSRLQKMVVADKRASVVRLSGIYFFPVKKQYGVALMM